MTYPSTDKHSLSPPTGMTSIIGQKLETLKTIYHDLVGTVIFPSSDESLLFSHFGDFDQAKNDNTLKMVESAILESGDKRQAMKRICSLLIEMLQNMSLHGARDRDGHMHAFLIVSKGKKSYKLFSGNLVLVEDLNSLDERMKELLKLDENELRKLYIEILCNEEFSHRGGAGLGLITIAKRAQQMLKYNLHRLDENFGYFQIEVELLNS